MSDSRSTRSASTHVVEVAADGVRVPIARQRLASLAGDVLRAERAGPAELSITFVDSARIAALNWRHLRHRGPTDIITFELARMPGGPISGDIYISPEVARQNARSLGTGVREEVARLVVHGVLHALGYEHPEGDERTTSPMWRAQERYLARYWTRLDR